MPHSPDSVEARVADAIRRSVAARVRDGQTDEEIRAGVTEEITRAFTKAYADPEASGILAERLDFARRAIDRELAWRASAPLN
jgi:hypothetical protein